MRHDAVTPVDRFVLAHGFTQTARSWARIETLLQAAMPNAATLAVDLPGHGDAPAPPDTDLWGSADRLVEVGGRGTYVGYSMGGRVALHAALRHPDRVVALVLIGATAGIDDAGERADRRTADEALAARIEDIGVPQFLDEWLANPLFAGLTEETAQRDDRLRNTTAGLVASLRSTGTGTQTPLWSRLDEIRIPVLVLVGEHDAKFTTLGERLLDGLPNASMHVIADAGHSVHLEQPAATVQAIASWASATPRGW